ncbi:MAG: short chain dehydrogenase family protein, partial [Akkermansiaceae bacterium]|nr:short chain dehydrogenase family protein [Akkermansiaceae bacterium]
VLPVQQPLPSGFGPQHTAAEVLAGLDLTGKVAIVTGGYSGIGTETTRVLAAAGAQVIVPARDLAKASAALAGIAGVEIGAMDLADPASIDAFADRFLATGRPLHILVNSAGIMACPLTRDARGYEMQFAVNHLGHFQLTTRLWPALVKAQGARVVAVSSLGHRYSPVVFDDIHYEGRSYDRMEAYGQSKTANILFAYEADRRGRPDGIRAFSLHPGRIIDTDLKRHFSDEDLKAAGAFDAAGNPVVDHSRGFKSVPQGASTSAWCAASPQLDGLGGLYCENNDVAVAVEAPVGTVYKFGDTTMNHGVLSYAIDSENAARLWEVSEQLLNHSDITKP